MLRSAGDSGVALLHCGRLIEPDTSPIDRSGGAPRRVSSLARPGALRHWGARDRAFPVAAVALCVLAVLPVWSSRFLPLLDEPNHLSALYIWKQLSDPSSPLHAYYRLAFAPVSYLLHYGLAYLTSWVVGVELAHKLLLSTYVLSFPVAGWLWCRATGRTVWLCLTTIPLAYSTSWSLGYHSFDAGLAACLFAVLAQHALLRAPSGWRALAACGLGLACYFGHPLALVMYWVSTLVLWCVLRPRASVLAWSVAGLLPGALLYRWQSLVAGVGVSGTLELMGPNFLRFSPEWVRDRVLALPAYAVNPLAGSADTRLFELMLIGVVFLLAVGAARVADYRSLLLASGLFASVHAAAQPLCQAGVPLDRVRAGGTAGRVLFVAEPGHRGWHASALAGVAGRPGGCARAALHRAGLPDVWWRNEQLRARSVGVPARRAGAHDCDREQTPAPKVWISRCSASYRRGFRCCMAATIQPSSRARSHSHLQRRTSYPHPTGDTTRGTSPCCRPRCSAAS